MIKVVRVVAGIATHRVRIKHPPSIAAPVVASIAREYASKRKNPVQAKPRPAKPTENRLQSFPTAEAWRILQAVSVGYERPSTVELHVYCHPPKQAAHIHGSVALPKQANTDIPVLVFAEGSKAEEAVEAGAEFVGGVDLIAQIQEGEVTGFKRCLSTPEMLPSVTKIARLLGPKGLMPTVGKGTVTNDLMAAVQRAKNTLDYRADSQKIIHTSNIDALLSHIRERVGDLEGSECVLLSEYGDPDATAKDK